MTRYICTAVRCKWRTDAGGLAYCLHPECPYAASYPKGAADPDDELLKARKAIYRQMGDRVKRRVRRCRETTQSK